MSSLVSYSQQTELEWQYYLSQMQKVEALKRDKIPAETLMAWFNTFKARGFKNDDLAAAVKKVMTAKTYGAVKIEDFFIGEQLLTEQEAELKTKRQIDFLVRDCERMLEGQSLEVLLPEVALDKKLLALAVQKRLNVYYGQEINEKASEVINEAVEIAAEKLGLKKIKYEPDTLSAGKRLKVKLGF